MAAQEHFDMNNGTSQGRFVLAKPRLGAFGSSGFGASPFGSILKSGSNPFLKVTEPEDKEPEKKDKPDTDNKETTGEEILTETKEDAPKFVPLGGTRSSTLAPAPGPAVPAQPASGTSGFVFGQNLSDRVVIQDSVNNGDAEPSGHSMKNGTSELLFTSAAASVKEHCQESASTSSTSSAGLAAAAAAEYERAQARPPPPAVATATGEEDELNVLQLSCRLFAWESGSWRERGRVLLRLNDSVAVGGDGVDASRLVARVAGSLRVVLNTKIWAGMVAEGAGSNSLRITATDASRQVKIFLIMGNPGDIVQLHLALLARVALCRRGRRRAGRPALPAAAPARPAPLAPLAPCDQPEGDGGDTESTDEETDSDVDRDTDSPNPLKRKESVKDETSPKRQCPFDKM